jgi:DNA-binding NarL/FixJ family response regulator
MKTVAIGTKAEGKIIRKRMENNEITNDKNSPSPFRPGSPSQITVLIADDHPIFRQGLRQVIAGAPALKIVGEAEDGEAALACIESILPAVAVLDVDMPKQDGFAVARAIIEKRLPVAIVFLTMHKDESLLNAALDLGVKGYVLKDSALADIVSSIKAVVAGENFISPALSTFLISRSRRSSGATAGQVPGVGDLSPTERRILNLISEYKTSKEIAEQLFISIRTVEHHRGNIAIKLRLRGAHALIKFALEHKSNSRKPFH